jgi:hypothetical protein
MKNVCKEQIVSKMMMNQIMCMVLMSLSHRGTRSSISQRHVRTEHYLLLNASHFYNTTFSIFFFYRSTRKINKNKIPSKYAKTRRKPYHAAIELLPLNAFVTTKNQVKQKFENADSDRYYLMISISKCYSTFLSVKKPSHIHIFILYITLFLYVYKYILQYACVEQIMYNL